MGSAHANDGINCMPQMSILALAGIIGRQYASLYAIPVTRIRGPRSTLLSLSKSRP